MATAQDSFHILLVDDEEHVVHALCRAVRARAKHWTLRTTTSPAEAISVLAKWPVHAIVTGIRFRESDGIKLLQHVQEWYPEAVRIVLSAGANEEAAIRAMSIAHQFLTKPTQLDHLLSVLDGVATLRTILPHQPLRRLAASLTDLPSSPVLYLQIRRHLEAPDGSLDDVAAIIEKEPAVAAKMLQLVNSAFFGLPQPCSDARRAVAYLGGGTVKALVLSMKAFGHDTRVPEGISIERVQDEGVLAANIVRRLLPIRGREADDAFVAALIHDIGLLIPDDDSRRAYPDILALARAEQIPFHEAERRVFDAGHAEMGAYLMGLWGLPSVVVEAVAYHHAPMPTGQLDVRAAVYLAVWLAESQALGRTGLGPAPDWLTSVGLLHEWPRLVDALREGAGGLRRSA